MDMDNLEKELERLKKEADVVPETVLNKVNGAYDTIRNKNGKEKKFKSKRKYILAATVLLTASLAFSPSVRAALKELIFSFNNKAIETAVSNDYYQKVENVELKNNEIEIKLENITIDPSKIAFDFSMNSEILKNHSYDNETNNVWENIEVYDENDMPIVKEGVSTGISVSGPTIRVEKDNGKERLKILYQSENASIPKVSKLKVKFNSIKFKNTKNEVIFDKKLNWDFEVELDSKLQSQNNIEYSYDNTNENIKIHKVTALPTGVYIKYSYFPVGHYENIGLVSKVIDENGNEYGVSDGINMETGEQGEDVISAVFKGITCFENIDKFTLEIPNPDGETVDKVEFIQNKSN